LAIARPSQRVVIPIKPVVDYAVVWELAPSGRAAGPHAAAGEWGVIPAELDRLLRGGLVGRRRAGGPTSARPGSDAARPALRARTVVLARAAVARRSCRAEPGATLRLFGGPTARSPQHPRCRPGRAPRRPNFTDVGLWPGVARAELHRCWAVAEVARARLQRCWAATGFRGPNFTDVGVWSGFEGRTSRMLGCGRGSMAQLQRCWGVVGVARARLQRCWGVVGVARARLHRCWVLCGAVI
jgi:hypothetical protein